MILVIDIGSGEYGDVVRACLTVPVAVAVMKLKIRCCPQASEILFL